MLYQEKSGNPDHSNDRLQCKQNGKTLVLKKGSLCQVFELVRLPGSLTNKQTKKSWK
jgi:hypothetical protein